MRRPLEWAQWTGGKDLTEMAARLHAVATGSDDDYDPARTARYVKALRWADEHWEPSHLRHADYDDAVRAQVRAAVAEWDAKQPCPHPNPINGVCGATGV